MRLTEEQIEAVDAFAGGSDLKVFAFAGAGKTTTLQAMADEARGPGLYLAFNRSIAADARAAFPEGTACSTMHALAFRALREEFGLAKLTETLTIADFVEILDLKERRHGASRLAPRAQAMLVRSALQSFMHGDARELSAADVPLTGALSMAPVGDCLALVADIVAKGRELWAQMADPFNPVPLSHDGYLKLWALGQPRLEADHIFLDEAQDTNPVVLGIVRRQDAQLAYVGDPHQRIYAWRGAVDVMTKLPAGRPVHLTHSFRFGEAIAAAATSVIATLGESRRIEGNPAVASTIGPCVPGAIIARTNAGVVDAVLDTLMIGERPHVVGGTGELLRLLAGVQELKEGNAPTVPELAGYRSWSEVEAASRERASGLRTLVGLVEEYGADRLMTALAQVEPDDDRADVVITTAHRAKGRQWDRVQLRDDFAASIGAEAVDPAELRLLYVALTRARFAVDVPDGLIDGADGWAEPTSRLDDRLAAAGA